MNANELADKLLKYSIPRLFELDELMQQAATMLRQQQAEYYSLLVNHDKLYAKVVEQQTEIEALKQTIDANNLSQNIGQFVKPAKTLTDDEIIEIWCVMEIDTSKQNIDFARAILRKAQEK